MKILAVAISLLVSTLIAPALTLSEGRAKTDVIIMRDGRIVEGKVNQMTQHSVRFNNSTSGVKLDELPLKSVYMIKSSGRGSLFITETGQRKSAPQIKINPKSTVVYTRDYSEIPVLTLDFDTGKIVYTTEKATKKNPAKQYFIDQNNVFLIVYPDGTSDVMADLTIAEEEKPEPGPTENVEQQDNLTVVFHTAKQGDNLKNVAERYNVDINELREWNEINAKTRDTSNLKPGQQLMIYVKKVN